MHTHMRSSQFLPVQVNCLLVNLLSDLGLCLMLLVVVIFLASLIFVIIGLVLSTFWWSVYQRNRLRGKTRLRNDLLLCRVGRRTLHTLSRCVVSFVVVGLRAKSSEDDRQKRQIVRGSYVQYRLQGSLF